MIVKSWNMSPSLLLMISYLFCLKMQQLEKCIQIMQFQHETKGLFLWYIGHYLRGREMDIQYIPYHYGFFWEISTLLHLVKASIFLTTSM